jgi:hypothetical protein
MNNERSLAKEITEGFEALKSMRNNEPVAWMSQGGDVTRSRDYFVEMGFTDLIPLYTHPVKELMREDRSKLIGTLKWAEDLLRVAGHDEAVSDVQDCLMILRKAQEK